MRVQDYLRAGNGLSALQQEFALRMVRHKCLPIALLNYTIHSPKTHPITRECRGLILNTEDWSVVGRSFPRFFNVGECPDLEKDFGWNDFVAEEKLDGSLITLFCLDGVWTVATRGSFAEGEIGCGAKRSWADVFWGSLRGGTLSCLKPGYSYAFELCSPYNQVVARHDTTQLSLLTAFNNASGEEEDVYALHDVAYELGVTRPKRYVFGNVEHCREWLESAEPTFEGFVLRDINNLRLKVKNKSYLALHRLKNNGNVFHPKNLLPLVLKGEADELMCYFPESATHVFDMVERLGAAKARLEAVWANAKKIASQKEFALYVTRHTPLASILFEARKRGVEPDEIWRESENILLRRLFDD